MGRTYAGILGLLAFCAVITRTVLNSGNVHTALELACCSLFAFAAIGYFVASIAAFVVNESLRTTIENELVTHAEPPGMDSPSLRD